jgi:hypothetical protein
VSVEDLLYLSHALDEPIGHFFPRQFTEELGEDELSVPEKELLIKARLLSKTDLRKLVARQEL